ncbi:MAG: protein serine/threonine phosphatase [Actinomycetia bacterium]|nr:protein serine/threonine phosphatase [Actinomycetes bacterium]
MDDPALGDAQEPATLCPVCHAPVFTGNNFCEACGHRISEEAPAAQVPAGGRNTAEIPIVEPPGAGDCTGCGAGTIDVDGYCERCGLRQPSGRDHVEFELAAPDGGVIAAGVSDKGLRHSKNEDAMALAATSDGVAAVVCDGVSSSPRPEDASRAAADTGVAVLLKELEAGADAETATRTAVLRAAQAVAALAASEHDAPACTYVSALTGAESITVGWVGDSRAYWLPAPPPDTSTNTRVDDSHAHWLPASGDGARLTDDDSWAEQMVALGALSEAEAQAHQNAHVLVGWLGADATAVEAHVRIFTPEGSGVVVVCSDGLWNYLPDASAIAGALAEALPNPPSGVGEAATGPDAGDRVQETGGKPTGGRPTGGRPTGGRPIGMAAAEPLAAARSLLRIALDSGGRDNITVVVIPFSPADPTGPVEPPAQPITEPAE